MLMVPWFPSVPSAVTMLSRPIVSCAPAASVTAPALPSSVPATLPPPRITEPGSVASVVSVPPRTTPSSSTTPEWPAPSFIAAMVPPAVESMVPCRSSVPPKPRTSPRLTVTAVAPA